MRRLIPLLLLLAPISVFGVTASALGQQDVETVPTETVPAAPGEPDEEEFGRDFEDRQSQQDEPEEPAPPPSEPTAAPSRPTPTPDPPPAASLPRTGTEVWMLLAAAYWLLLGGVVLRRVTSLR